MGNDPRRGVSFDSPRIGIADGRRCRRAIYGIWAGLVAGVVADVAAELRAARRAEVCRRGPEPDLQLAQVRLQVHIILSAVERDKSDPCSLWQLNGERPHALSRAATLRGARRRLVVEAIDAPQGRPLATREV